MLLWLIRLNLREEVVGKGVRVLWWRVFGVEEKCLMWERLVEVGVYDGEKEWVRRERMREVKGFDLFRVV